jgi:DNA-binding IclR family transcriptional regulator
MIGAAQPRLRLSKSGTEVELGTITKALELLDLFTRQTPQIGLSEAARISGTNKATCFRLLTELMAYGLVEQDSRTRDYRLGPAVLRLAALREAAVPLRTASRPILTELAEATGESAHSSVLTGGLLKMLDFVYSHRHATKVIFEDTEVLPFHATSSGLAALAFAPSGLVDQVLEQNLAPITADTVTDPAKLRENLTKVRASGYAISDGGFEADVIGIAVPVFGQNGECIGAFAVATPKMRMTPVLHGQILRALVDASSRISRLLGGILPTEIVSIWRNIAAEKDMP